MPVRILGLGVDLVPVSRLASARGARFDRRVFTPAELAHARRSADPDERLAARFAAKEAVMKALGTGWGKGVGWRQIEVRTGRDGAPALRLSGAAARLARRRGVRAWHLSLSHAGGMAVAVALAEGDA